MSQVFSPGRAAFGAAGGNLTLRHADPAKSAVGVGLHAADGDIIFQLANGTEVLRLSGDGGVFVRGRRVDDDAAILPAFRRWLSGAARGDESGGEGA